MRGRKRSAALSAVIVASAFSFTSCSDQKQALVVYSPHGREMLSEYERLYEQAHPEVDVTWFPMGAEMVIERLRGERNNPQADLWWGGPSPLFEQGTREGLVSPYAPTWKGAAVDGSFDRTEHWFSTFQTAKVIGFNSDELDVHSAPQDWDELLDAKWAGKVIIRSPMESGTMKSVFAAMVYRFFAEDGKPDRGYDWLRRLDANTKAYAASPATLMLMIGRKEGLVTLWDLTDILLQRREQNVPMGFVIPRSGALVLNEGIAIVKGSPHRAEAERFYEFVSSKQAVLHQAERFYRLPARNDIADAEKPDWLRAIAIKEFPVDWNAIGEHREEWLRQWDQNIKGRNR